MLEVDSSKLVNVVPQSKWPQSDLSQKWGNVLRKQELSNLASLLTSKRSDSCPQCSGPHEVCIFSGCTLLVLVLLSNVELGSIAIYASVSFW